MDPSKREGVVEASGLEITNRYVCSHETPAFFITMLVFEGGLILVGCVLAFLTRKLGSEYNESKQMILSMYGTAAISTILVVVATVTSINQSQMRLLFTLGVFWATCLASSVFVIPRIISMRKPRETTRISGITIPVVVPQQGSRDTGNVAPFQKSKSRATAPASSKQESDPDMEPDKESQCWRRSISSKSESGGQGFLDEVTERNENDRDV